MAEDFNNNDLSDEINDTFTITNDNVEDTNNNFLDDDTNYVDNNEGNLPYENIEEKNIADRENLTEEEKSDIRDSINEREYDKNFSKSSVDSSDFGGGLNYPTYNASDSHENVINSAGGETGYDFRIQDPRLNSDSKMFVKDVVIDDKENCVRGINLEDNNGNFAVSYTGDSYGDILSQNKADCDTKAQLIKEAEEKYLAKKINNYYC